MKILSAVLFLACAPEPEAAPNDADGDGYSWFAGDCDDTDPEVHPGAEDAWYDGLDADCAGNDDHDADGDGSPLPDDCDEADAAVRPGALETAGDGLDADCDGDPDGAGFVEFTASAEGTRGPRLTALPDGSVGLMLLDDTPAARYRSWHPSTGEETAYTTVLDGYTLGAPLAFAPTGTTDALATSVYDEGFTYLGLLSLHTDGGEAWTWTGRGWPTDELADFLAADVQLEGGVVTMLGCGRVARLSRPVLLLRGTVEDFTAHEYTYAWARSGPGGEACVIDGDDLVVLDSGACARFSYDGSSTLAAGADWGRGYLALAAGDGLLVAAREDALELRESVDDEPVVVAVSKAPDLVRVARAPDGSARVLWRSDAGLWLYDSVTNESKALSPSEAVLDAAVVVTEDGVLVVAVRTASAVWTSMLLGG